MAGFQGARVSLTVIAVLIALWSAKAAYVFLAPLTLAIFVLALVWPAQKTLQMHVPKVVAAAVTLVGATLVLALFGFAIVWASGAVWSNVAAQSERYQLLYQSVTDWLEKNGIVVGALWADGFNVNWMLRAVQQAFSRMSQFTSFLMVAVAYLLTGLIEVDAVENRLDRFSLGSSAKIMLDTCRTTAKKLRTYIWVRTVISLLTGFCFGVVIYALDVPLAPQWAVIAFVLNYIPFIGPLIATILPTVFGLVQLGDPWTAFVLFSTLTVVQFVSGNYLEPVLSGGMLTLSPFVILASIFLWTFLWGIYGTFIGVPIAIAVASFAASSPSAAWLAALMGAEGPEPDPDAIPEPPTTA